MLFAGTPISSPLGSVDFLDDLETTLKTKFQATTVQELFNPNGRCIWIQTLFITFQLCFEIFWSKSENVFFAPTNSNQEYFDMSFSVH